MRLFMTATLLSFAAVGADAQSTTTRIAVAGGIATDQRGVRSTALGISPSVVVEPAEHVAAQLGGSLTRFATDAFSFGGGASLTAAQPLGSLVALTLGGTAGATRLQGSSRGTFIQADVTPALELRLRPLTLFAGARAASGTSTNESAPGGLPVPSRSETTTRGGAGPLFGGALTLPLEDRATLRLSAREERLRVAGVTAAERSMSAELSVALTSAASLEIGAGRYDANRLLATPAGEYATVGIAWSFGRTREPAPPAVSGAQPAPRGTTRLSLRAPDAKRVEIAGDFNEWKPAVATRAANGMWYADLMIPPGQYRYAFRVDGVEWRVPDGATAVEDGFGGKSAWLTVSDARSRE